MTVDSDTSQPTLIGAFQNLSGAGIRAGALLLLLCLAFVQFFFFGSTFPGTSLLFLWPRLTVILLVIQILCFLILARHAVIRVFRQRRIPWSALSGTLLLLVGVFMFYWTAAVQEPYYAYRLAQDGRVYMLTEAKIWLGCVRFFPTGRGYQCAFYYLYSCDSLELVCTRADTGPTNNLYGAMAIPINGQPPAEGEPRAYPILRATGDTIQIISDMSEDGIPMPDGVVFYTYTPPVQLLFSLPLLIVLVLLVFGSGYLMQIGWSMERVEYKKRKAA